MQRTLKLSRKCLPTNQGKVQCTEPVISQKGIYNYKAAFPPGIENRANNCYANAVLQCLMHHPNFVKFTNRIRTTESNQPGNAVIIFFNLIASIELGWML